VRRPRTLDGDLAEDGGVARQSAAVPATVAELLLALADGQVRGVRDAQHHVRMQATDEALVTAQSGRVITDHSRRHPGQRVHRLLA